jgi:hypothetical protein
MPNLTYKSLLKQCFYKNGLYRTRVNIVRNDITIEQINILNYLGFMVFCYRLGYCYHTNWIRELTLIFNVTALVIVTV